MEPKDVRGPAVFDLADRTLVETPGLFANNLCRGALIGGAFALGIAVPEDDEAAPPPNPEDPSAPPIEPPTLAFARAFPRPAREVALATAFALARMGEVEFVFCTFAGRPLAAVYVNFDKTFFHSAWFW